MTSAPAPTTTAALKLAEWAQASADAALDADLSTRARAILLDTLACALAGHTEPAAHATVQYAQQSGAGTSSIIGTDIRTSLPLASFANSALVRTLDYNDIYTGPTTLGHPSDNIPVALAAAEAADRSGRELLQAIRIGYELYGRILDLSDPTGPFDHVSMSGPTAAAMAGVLLRLPTDRLAHAIALAAAHSTTFVEVRRGHISAAKSIANAVVVQTATMLTLLAGQGVTGPERAIEGGGGFVTLLANKDIASLFDPSPGTKLLNIQLKTFPCFALAQAPLAAALDLRALLHGKTDAIGRITLLLGDSGAARMRVGALHLPTSREQADHSLHYLIAVALHEGEVTIEQFETARWTDPAVVNLMQRIDLGIDPEKAPRGRGAFPFHLTIDLAGGERHVRMSSVQEPFTEWSVVVAKFRQCARALLSDAAQDKVIGYVERLDDLPSVRTLMAALRPDRQ